MANPSNLYAEKIFSEHPLSLWALDEDMSYVSFITEEQRGNSFWMFSEGASLAGNPLPESIPFENSNTLSVQGPTPTGAFETMYLYSLLPSAINQTETTFGAYLYDPNGLAISYGIGYAYDNGGTPEFVVKNFSVPQTEGSWILVSETFRDIPSSAVSVVIQITYAYSPTITNPDFFINGVTAGYQSEEFLAVSLGTELSATSNIIIGSDPSDVVLGAPAISYGLIDSPGYYCFSSESVPAAKNTGIPMVYGAQGVTRLYNNGDSPSLVLPTSGFMHSDYYSSEYTAEFWLRAATTKLASGKIFGPTDSDSGLYIDAEFIRLKVGGNVASHYVGNWFRPMLIDVKISPKSASLMINAEEVLSIELTSQDFDSLSTIGKSGFYVPAGVDYLEVDAVAIYSYLVTNILAKRRMVYAQAVEAPDGVSKTFGGKLALVDYSVADYTSNYSYPDIGRFNQGIGSNITINRSSLSAPDYPAQNIQFKSSNLESLISNSSSQDPTLGYNGLYLAKDTSHLKFDSFSLSDSSIYGMYGVFSADDLILETGPATDAVFSWAAGHSFETGDLVSVVIPNVIDLGEYYISKIDSNSFLVSDSLSDAKAGVASSLLDYLSYTAYKFSYVGEQTLILVANKANGDTFRISLADGGLRYSSNISSIYTEMLFEPGIATYPLFSLGFSIDNIKSYFSQYVGNFFDNVTQLEMYVGSNSDFSDRFVGTIYRFGLCDARNYSQISEYFLAYTDEPFDVGSIELNPTGEASFWSLVLDGGFPESTYGISQIIDHVASYTVVVKNTVGILSLDIATSSSWQDSIALSHFAQYVTSASSNYYDIDFIQFNIDYPANYNLDSGSFDTSNSRVKTYISFQTTASGANSSISTFTNIKPLDSSRTVIPGDEWVTTAYEVVDRSIIYMPKNIDLTKLSIVTHVELILDGVNTNPILIKRIEYASQAFNDDTANPVGTKYAVNLYPYVKSGSFFDYKAINPHIIYKRSTPHLYLTDSSGIEIVGDTDQYLSRGILMQVNESSAPEYRIKSLQVFVKPTFTKFSSIPSQIFEIETASGLIKFFVKKSDQSGKMGKIYAIYSSTGMSVNGIVYYINGKLSKSPILTINEWSAIGISFATPLSFDSFVGAIRMSGNILFNAISFYESSKLEEVERQSLRSWNQVRTGEVDGTPTTFDWAYTLKPQPGTTYSWGDVLIISSTDYYGADISSLYGSYTGTNKLIVDDNHVTGIGSSRFVVRNGIIKTSTIANAV